LRRTSPTTTTDCGVVAEPLQRRSDLLAFVRVTTKQRLHLLIGEGFVDPDLGHSSIALNSVIDRTRIYSVTTNAQGVITLTPISVVLNDEQLADLRTDPSGFVALLDASDRHRDGTGRGGLRSAAGSGCDGNAGLGAGPFRSRPSEPGRDLMCRPVPARVQGPHDRLHRAGRDPGRGRRHR